jgi:hypothetical protein
MARGKTELKAFNRGLVSRLGLARTDLERTGISAETMTNWMPRNLGSMMLRPGTQYIGNTASNAQSRYIPFIYSSSDTALVEFAISGALRFWASDALVSTNTVSTAIIQGDMTDDTISNATQANPCEITTTSAHPYSTGDTVWLTDFAGMTELNNREFTITSTGANTFTLNGEDARFHGAYASGGAANAWIDDDEAGATSTNNTHASLTTMFLTGSGAAAARRTQKVTVAGGDQNVEHTLLVTVGGSIFVDNTQYISGVPVKLRIGTTDGGDELLAETRLGNGSHALTFTPTGATCYIQFLNSEAHPAIVNTAAILSGSNLQLTHPYTTAARLRALRYDQSADVVYLACGGLPQYKVERRGAGSWSFVYYEPPDGPFGLINTTSTTVSINDISGNLTLSASKDLWRTDMQGSLIKLIASGQTQTASITAQNTFTSAIRVTGVTDSRVFTVDIDFSAPGSATVTLQRSFTSEGGPWADVPNQSYAGTGTSDNQNFSYDDTKDNQIAWYRIGVKTGDFTSGTIAVTLSYANGESEGIARIYDVTDSMTASAISLRTFGDTAATADWYLGEWSDFVGYPTSVAFHEGRLCWFGRNKAWLSVSDAYESFDPETVGDSGPITRTIGSGPVDTVEWALSLTRLTIGTDGREFEIRSSKDDEPLTPSNAALKGFGTQGAGNTLALQMDKTGLYVQRGGVRLREVSMSENWEYDTSDLTTFNPDIGKPEITHIALQRQPDNRVHCVRSDGTVAVLLHDAAENVTCWVEVESANDRKVLSWALTDAYSGDGIATSGNISMAMNPELNRMFVAFSGDLKQYSLTGGDLSTMSPTGNGFDFNISSTFGTSTCVGLFVNKDGTRVYAVDTIGFDGVIQYNLSSPWDASTATASGNSLDVSSETTNPRGVCLSDDGRSVFVGSGSGGKVLRYSLNNPWELEGATLASDELTLTASPFPRGIAISTDGSEMWVTGQAYSDVSVYSLPIANNLAGGALTREIDINTAGITAPEALFVVPDQEDFYVADLPAGSDNGIHHFTGTDVSVAAAVEDVVVLPGADGDGEDAVYYSVKHTLVDESVVRFLEKWSLESECQGGTLNKNLDAHITGTVSGGVLTGLTHLEGETVGVWVNGVDTGTYPVISGQVTSVTADGSAVAGLTYKAQFKSAKLGNLLDKKNLARLGVILDKTHYQGLQYGPDFSNLDDLPLVEDGVTQADDTQHDQYDEEAFSFDGRWDTDSRLCLQAASPRNCTLLAAIIETEE